MGDRRTLTRSELPIDRIVVVANEDNDEPLLDMAAQMAEALRAELHGLFIRSEALNDFAALPFAATSRPGARQSQPVNPEAIEKAWTKGETRFRRSLGRLATERRTTCSFMSRRGKFGMCLTEGVRSTDLIALSGDAPWVTGAMQFEAAREAAQSAFGVLISGRSQRRARGHRGPVFAINCGDPADAETVTFATMLAQVTGRSLVVLDIGATDLNQSAPPRGLERMSNSVRRMPGASAQQIMKTINEFGPALVVADLRGEMFSESEDNLLDRLLARLKPPLMLISRGAGGGD
ncbi:MAG: hypothetical protein AAF367_20750 [Pseudomonadota bacterium]